jgi:ATP-binding protein involved in chromosome partitioning
VAGVFGRKNWLGDPGIADSLRKDIRMAHALTEGLILEQLKLVKYPGFTRDIVSFGLIKGIQIEGGRVIVKLQVTTAEEEVPRKLREEATAVIEALGGVESADVQIEVGVPPATPGAAGTAGALTPNEIPGVKHVIAVASGKGGVGKSTVAANLALALQQAGKKTALCDCDIYGPSIAFMFGSEEEPTATEEDRINPIMAHGLKLMSMGFFLKDNMPAILRGPMVTRYTQQFLRQVDWGDLDILVLDLPPGTGDIQLTIVQTVALAGAVVVSTPQEVALIDARKAVAMFERVNVPVLGLVENMSYFLSPSDHKKYHIFGEGGGAKEAQRLGVPLLAEIPLEIPLREAADAGIPLVARNVQSPALQEFKKLAQGVLSALVH